MSKYPLNAMLVIASTRRSVIWGAAKKDGGAKKTIRRLGLRSERAPRFSAIFSCAIFPTAPVLTERLEEAMLVRVI